MTVYEQISHETMVFMRGKYRLDEIGDGKDELKFKQGQKTILTIYIREDKYTFLIIFGRKERESFEMQKSGFSKYICDHYDEAKTYHDGKWMFIDVTTLEQLEEVKKLIMIKKKPNRKPFSKENALYSKCGQRCDLCVHYIHLDEELRSIMIPQLIKMWGQTDWSMRCEGCYSDNCYCKDEPCNGKSCATQNCLSECKECKDFPCIKATSADYRSMIHTEVHYADEITWGILPYVPMQYETMYEQGVRMSGIYKIRKFRAEDAGEVSALIAKTLRTVNIKDYSEEYIEANVSSHSPDVLIERAKQGHMYVAYDDSRIVGCGAIAGYWGSTTESILLTIFVLPEYQGKGIGTLMIQTLEQDEFFLRAKRIEIPASITAVGFYRKMGYDYKNGIAEIDDEQVYRLEKFR